MSVSLEILESFTMDILQGPQHPCKMNVHGNIFSIHENIIIYPSCQVISGLNTESLHSHRLLQAKINGIWSKGPVLELYKVTYQDHYILRISLFNSIAMEFQNFTLF